MNRLAAAGAIVVASCAHVRPLDGVRLSEPGVFVNGVPPILQESGTDCGQACLKAMVLYCSLTMPDARADVPALMASLPEPGADGSSAQYLSDSAASIGLESYEFHGSRQLLESNLLSGRPLIVMVSPVTSPELAATIPLLHPVAAWRNAVLARRNHWVVAIGLSGASDVVVMDPLHGYVVWDGDAFQRAWSKRAHLAVLVTGAGVREGTSPATETAEGGSR